MHEITIAIVCPVLNRMSPLVVTCKVKDQTHAGTHGAIFVTHGRDSRSTCEHRVWLIPRSGPFLMNGTFWQDYGTYLELLCVGISGRTGIMLVFLLTNILIHLEQFVRLGIDLAHASS